MRIARERQSLLAVIALAAAFGVAAPGIGAAQGVAMPPSMLGQTGVVAVSGADVLPRGRVRVGINGLVSEGSGGSRVDSLLLEADADATLLLVRGSLAVGLPSGFEAAVSLPYVRSEVDQDSTDGIGDTALSLKLKAQEQSGWRPATAVSFSWVPETARSIETATVSNNGFQTTVSTQLALQNSTGWSWTMVGELGGFLRDPGQTDSDSHLIYGVAGIFPLIQTGFYVDVGVVQFVAEVSGTVGRADATGQDDDSASLVPGLRYLTERWGVTGAAVFTSYEATGTTNSVGGVLEIHLLF